MQLAATFAMALLFTLSPPAWARQDAGSSSASSTQVATSPPEKSHNAASDQAPPPADPSQEKRKPDQVPPDSVEKTTSPKSTSGHPASAARKHRSRGHKLAVAPAGDGEPHKIVIRRGGVSEPATQIIPGMTLEESNRQRQQAQDLLAAADSDLKKLADRNLNPSQQETVSQIHHYMDVARSALDEGDFQRAHTLAQKAQLLSDDLVKH
jgi:hypothetical protein